MADSTVNIIHELTFTVNEASVQKVDATISNISRSLQALTANTRQVSTNLNAMFGAINKNVGALNQYTASLRRAADATARFGQINQNVGNTVSQSISRMTAGVNQAMKQIQNMQNALRSGLAASAQRVNALNDEAAAAARTAAAVQNLQNAYNGLRPPPTPPAGGGGGGGRVGGGSGLGPMGGEGMFGVSGDYLMRRFVSGYIVGGGFRAVNFAIDTVKQFISEASEMASKVDGISKAFERLGDTNLLENLRQATRGTVTDLDLMQKAVNAVNLGLPVDKLATAFKFAAIRARETGQDVDYLVNSIVLGIGRKSPLILDNLGINALRVRTRFKEIGDFGQAAFDIINEEILKSGQYVDQYADRVDRLTASIKNQQTQLGQTVNALKDYSLALLADVLRIEPDQGPQTVGGGLAGSIFGSNVGVLFEAREAAQKDKELNTKAQEKADNRYELHFGQYQKRLRDATVNTRLETIRNAEIQMKSLVHLADQMPQTTEEEREARLITLRSLDFEYQKFNRTVSETKANIKGLKPADLLPYTKEQLEQVQATIKLERASLSAGPVDASRVAWLNSLDDEATRLLAIIEGTTKLKKERIAASIDLDLRRQIAKREEDIEQAREARHANSLERIETLRDAEFTRGMSDLKAVEDDARRRGILTEKTQGYINKLRSLLETLVALKDANDRQALFEKQAIDRQTALQNAVEAGRRLMERQEKQGGVTSIDRLTQQLEAEREAAEKGEKLRHTQQLKALEGQDDALEDEKLRHTRTMEDIDLDYYKRSVDAVADYYDQVRQAMQRGALLTMQPITEIGTRELERLNARGRSNLLFNRARQRRLIGIRQNVRERTAEAETAQGFADLAGQEFLTTFGRGTFGAATPDQEEINTRAIQDASLKATDARRKAAEAADKQTEAEENYSAALKENIPRIVDIYNEMANSVTQAYNQISQAQQQQFNTEIKIREERIRAAEGFAERGNTLYLRQEQDRLDRSYRQQAEAANKQMLINTALAASQAALGAVSAAVQGDPYTAIARVIAFLAAISSGIIQATNTANSSMPSVQFWEGGFTGEGDKYQPAGTVHKGEFVSNQETTRRHRKVLESMHAGTFDDQYVRIDQAGLSMLDMPVSKRDKQMLAKLDGLREAIEGNNINVRQTMDQRGLTQVVEQVRKQDRTRFSG